MLATQDILRSTRVPQMCIPLRLVVLSATVFLAAQFAAGQNSPAAAHSRTVAIDAGVPLHVVLDKRVSFTKVGQRLQGHVAQPVYVFDRVAVPAGTPVLGKVTEVHSVSRMKRFDALLGGDFTPLREAQVEFDTLVL